MEPEGALSIFCSQQNDIDMTTTHHKSRNKKLKKQGNKESQAALSASVSVCALPLDCPVSPVTVNDDTIIKENDTTVNHQDITCSPLQLMVKPTQKVPASSASPFLEDATEVTVTSTHVEDYDNFDTEHVRQQVWVKEVPAAPISSKHIEEEMEDHDKEEENDQDNDGDDEYDSVPEFYLEDDDDDEEYYDEHCVDVFEYPKEEDHGDNDEHESEVQASYILDSAVMNWPHLAEAPPRPSTDSECESSAQEDELDDPTSLQFLPGKNIPSAPSLPALSFFTLDVARPVTGRKIKHPRRKKTSKYTTNVHSSNDNHNHNHDSISQNKDNGQEEDTITPQVTPKQKAGDGINPLPPNMTKTASPAKGKITSKHRAAKSRRNNKVHRNKQTRSDAVIREREESSTNIAAAPATSETTTTIPAATSKDHSDHSSSITTQPLPRLTKSTSLSSFQSPSRKLGESMHTTKSTSSSTSATTAMSIASQSLHATRSALVAAAAKMTPDRPKYTSVQSNDHHKQQHKHHLSKSSHSSKSSSRRKRKSHKSSSSRHTSTKASSSSRKSKKSKSHHEPHHKSRFVAPSEDQEMQNATEGSRSSSWSSLSTSSSLASFSSSSTARTAQSEDLPRYLPPGTDVEMGQEKATAPTKAQTLMRSQERTASEQDKRDKLRCYLGWFWKICAFTGIACLVVAAVAATTRNIKRKQQKKSSPANDVSSALFSSPPTLSPILVAPTAPPTQLPTAKQVARSWMLRGQTLYGQAENDQFGSSVAISGNGMIMAVGASYAEPNFGRLYDGYVQVFRFDTDQQEWTEWGPVLESDMDDYGYAVALSNDGTTLATSVIANNANGRGVGSVRVWKYNDFLTTWEQVGTNQFTGYAHDVVTLSADGTIAAFVVNTDIEGDNKVRVMRYNGNDWDSMGQDLGGLLRDEFTSQPGGGISTTFVSLSADGKTVAIGGDLYDASLNLLGGAIQIFLFDDETSSWNPLGEALEETETFDGFGSMFALSADGSIVATGAAFFDDDAMINKGRVRVFEYDEERMLWKPFGQSLEGQVEGGFLGRSISLSADGLVLAASAPFEVGAIRVFRMDETLGLWEPVGSDVVGEFINDKFGHAVALSGDGKYIVGSSVTHDSEYGDRSGHVRVFEMLN